MELKIYKNVFSKCVKLLNILQKKEIELVTVVKDCSSNQFIVVYKSESEINESDI